jgi:hypothetical protein
VIEGPFAFSAPSSRRRHKLAEKPVGPMAWLAVAAALLAKTPSLQLAAGDLLVAATETDRIDPAGLGAAFAFYARNDIVSAIASSSSQDSCTGSRALAHLHWSSGSGAVQRARGARSARCAEPRSVR